VVASPWTVTPTHGVAAFLAAASRQTLITGSNDTEHRYHSSPPEVLRSGPDRKPAIIR
jgi:hypothetical protein